MSVISISQVPNTFFSKEPPSELRKSQNEFKKPLIEVGCVKILQQIPRTACDDSTSFGPTNQFNHKLPSWKRAEWLSKKLSPSIKDFDKLSRIEKIKRARIHELQKLEIPLDEKKLSDLLGATAQLKTLLIDQHSEELSPAYEVQIDGRKAQIETYRRTRENKRDRIELLLTFFDEPNIIATGSYKAIYHAWTLNGQPKHLAISKTKSLQMLSYIKQALNEAHYLDLLYNSRKKGEPISTVKPYKHLLYFISKADGSESLEQLIVMKYHPVCFIDLLKWIMDQEPGKVPFDRKVRLALKIARSYKYLQDKKVLQRDVKAENLLISKHNNPIICDLGMATANDNIEGLKLIRGSKDYFPFEMIEEIMLPKEQDTSTTPLKTSDYMKFLEKLEKVNQKIIKKQKRLDTVEDKIEKGRQDLVDKRDGIARKLHKLAKKKEKRESKLFASDNWGLGLLFFMLFEESAFPWMDTRFSINDIESEIKKFHDDEPDSRSIEHLIWRLLNPDFLKRPSIKKVIKELKGFRLDAKIAARRLSQLVPNVSSDLAVS